MEIMRSLQVAVVQNVGKLFDSSLHEAIAREESQDCKEGIIIEEFCHGFLLGGSASQTSMVKVSSLPSEKSSGQPATTGVDER
ncbi:GrpE nucleotide exchange factor [Corchorus capsularis]|uniref:GrpE nucleotide exchange factor n=1 Tax=Corchorus capsularis TaxID=210143 RepID=A0A1R3JLP7_COCAP|nr:GrpE nucleotide exchange factor [Corchorus capsularis]